MTSRKPTQPSSGALDGTIKGRRPQPAPIARRWSSSLSSRSNTSQQDHQLPGQREDIYQKDGAGNYILDADGNKQLTTVAQGESADTTAEIRQVPQVRLSTTCSVRRTETGQRREGQYALQLGSRGHEADPANSGELRSRCAPPMALHSPRSPVND